MYIAIRKNTYSEPKQLSIVRNNLDFKIFHINLISKSESKTHFMKYLLMLSMAAILVLNFYQKSHSASALVDRREMVKGNKSIESIQIIMMFGGDPSAENKALGDALKSGFEKEGKKAEVVFKNRVMPGKEASLLPEKGFSHGIIITSGGKSMMGRSTEKAKVTDLIYRYKIYTASNQKLRLENEVRAAVTDEKIDSEALIKELFEQFKKVKLL